VIQHQVKLRLSATNEAKLNDWLWPCIYRIRHVFTGKTYIGQTIDLKRRMNEHCYKQSKCPKLKAAIQKYGKDAFEVEILQSFSVGEIDNQSLKISMTIAEQFWMDQERSTGHCEFNLSLIAGPGFMLGAHHSEETRFKMSKSRKGVVMSPEWRERIGDAHRGKIISKKQREQIRLSLLGKKHTPEACKNMGLARIGRIISQETKDKIAAKHKGKKLSHETIVKRSATRYANLEFACGFGHPWTPESTMIRKSGKRECRICANSAQRRRRQNSSINTLVLGLVQPSMQELRHVA